MTMRLQCILYYEYCIRQHSTAELLNVVPVDWRQSVERFLNSLLVAYYGTPWSLVL